MKDFEILILNSSPKFEDNQELVFDRIPKLFEQLENTETIRIRKYFENSLPTSKILIEINKELNFFKENILPNDFSGLYVFYLGERPFYVGISRKILNRIKQHLKGSSHFNATLAHKLCRQLHPSEAKTRLDFHKEKKEEIEKVQECFMNCEIKLFPLNDPNELYLLEVYASLKLKTPFNDFKTH